MTEDSPTLFHYEAGGLSIYTAPRPMSPTRPLVVFLHGALRSATALTPWTELLGGAVDVALVDLPGHGHSAPIPSATVQSMAAAILEALDPVVRARQVVLVGESIGGTIALAMAGMGEPAWLRGLLLADPPMTTAKLWSVADEFRLELALRPDQPFLRRFASEALGVTDTAAEEIIYYPLLGRVRVPTLIVTGDRPLFPAGGAHKLVSVFDEVDRFVVETFYGGAAQVRQLSDCGHLVLVDAHEECRRLILQLLEQCDLPQPAA